MDRPTPPPTTAEQSTYDPPAFFELVYAEECAAVRERRAGAGLPVGAGPLTDLRGVALSGGGIRSATFCLGVLQHLASDGRLKCIDYLSTVSGGGFIGGWWSAWLARRQGQATPGAAPAIFPVPEDIELARQGAAADYTPDGSRSAGVDPIHHVRLFSNYLTPRKGALSADTWRAITVISRNLVITLLTLLPILGAGVFLAQLYFTADSNLAAPFVCGPVENLPDSARAAAAGLPLEGPDGSTAGSASPVPGRTVERFCGLFDPVGATESGRRLQVRFARALVPVVILVAWLALATLYWALAGTGDLRLAGAALVAVIVMLWLAVRALTFGGGSAIVQEIQKDRWLGWTLLIGAGALTAYASYLAIRRSWQGRNGLRGSLSAAQGEVLTNRLTRLQTVLLATLVLVTVVLMFGGFGHELARAAFVEGRTGLASWVRKTGGWGAVLLAIAGSVFTAFKAGPTGGGDARGAAQPGGLASIAFVVTPPLVILVLLVALATGSHTLLGTLLTPPPGTLSSLHWALLMAMLICAVFACYEFYAGERSGRLRRFLIVAAAIGLGFGAYHLPLPARKGATALAAGGLGVIIAAWLALELLPRLQRRVEVRTGRESPKGGAGLRTALLAAPLALAGVGFALGGITESLGQVNQGAARATFAGMTFAATFLALLALVGRRSNLRAMWLLTLVYLLLTVTYIEQFLQPALAQVFYPQAIVAFIGVALAAVVGLGWLTDPNYLSLHTFYRARLVRAYLGASNMARRDAEITESVDGDDLPLSEVLNAGQSGPFHLVNTTLNLVAARDLATAQRSADGFTLSAKHCGSLRTGYRSTRTYMGGRLTLGTALAVSGAAASPNMGAKTLSTPLAMLMALLNVRLGFWAPNPARSRWRVPRPRLWPFYVLREFLSQTNDLSSFCYLTDGGHFDNTGLYSLVQRGCRNIILVDCGADPQPCFSDLGDAIRRCRIDFRAEITLNANDFIRPGDQRLSGAHFVVGEIRYDADHLRRLGWGDAPDATARTGFIVWIKPSLLASDPAEVRQYALENPVFPQQTTADQWFDEAQFESYRRLGVECARAALANQAVGMAFPVQ
ncbi:MAG: hypothetical protein ACREOQ_03355 [Gemmatimonadales bacterium]